MFTCFLRKELPEAMIGVLHLCPSHRLAGPRLWREGGRGGRGPLPVCSVWWASRRAEHRADSSALCPLPRPVPHPEVQQGEEDRTPAFRILKTRGWQGLPGRGLLYL